MQGAGATPEGLMLPRVQDGQACDVRKETWFHCQRGVRSMRGQDILIKSALRMSVRLLVALMRSA